MKKILATILSMFYLILSVGFISYNVYCQDKLMETSVFISNHSCDKCPNCAEKQCEKDGDCCKHNSDYQQLKVDQNYSPYHIDITPQQVVILNMFLSGIDFLAVVKTDKESYPVVNAPPIGQKPIHILNCTYLI